MKTAQRRQLQVSGVDIAATVVSNATITTDKVFQRGNIGFMSLIMKISGNIAITYEVSEDGTTWSTPYTTDGTTLTSAGNVATDLTSDSWIIMTARLAHYVRFKFTSTGSSTISAKLLWQDES